MSFLINPYVFGRLLDLYPNSAAAYSLRNLSNSYTGAVVRVRRSSDNTEQDFTAIEITNGTLATFCGSNNGFVTTWYDQSGNGNNATQTTQTNQPKIYDSATGLITQNGKPAIKFDGVDDCLTNNSLFYTGAMTIVSVAQMQTSTVGSFIIIPSTSPPTSSLQELAFASAAGGPYLKFLFNQHSTNNASSFGNNLPTADGNQLLLFWTYNNGSASSSSSYTIHSNSTNYSVNTGGLVGYVGEIFSIGGRSQQRYNSFSKSIQEIIFYNSDQSSNRSGMETNINTHYTIY